MRGVVEAVATLHAQAAVVRRSVLAGDEFDDVLLHVVGQQAADAAERAYRVDRLVDGLKAHFARRHQRAGRAGLHALAAGDAGRGAHRVVHVEHDARVLAAVGVADHVVHLLLSTGAHAARALDAGIEVDRDGGVRNVGFRLLPALESGQAEVHLPRPQLQLVVLRVLPFGHVGKKQLEDHLLRQLGARVVGSDLHSLLRVAAARRRERALALDLDHAGAAVAVGPHAGLVAEVRDLDAVLLRRLDDRLVGAADYRLAVELELNRHHGQLLRRNPFHRLESLYPSISCRKYFMTVNAGLGAAWPRPQIDASIMA
jgi:hypothetical protein